MRNRRFVRRLDTTLRKIENPRTVMREPVKKTPPKRGTCSRGFTSPP